MSTYPILPEDAQGSTRPKVFGIGFHKTGTSSLAEALRTLGYRVTGPNGVNDPKIDENLHRLTARLLREFDAFQDNPWPLVYKTMDILAPGSKFVLTVRPSDAWIKSVVAHFGARETPMRKLIYGVGAPQGREETYVIRYERHNQEVMEYFCHRPADLLVLRLTEGEGWPKLCDFLRKSPPPIQFPHKNKAVDRPRLH